MDKVAVAIAQVSPDYMDKNETLNKVCEVVEKVAGKAKIVVFPETFVPGYPYWRSSTGEKWASYMVEYQRNSVKIPEDLEQVCDAAKASETFVVLGVSELDDKPGSLTLYNSIVFIDSNGKIAGKHRKLVPTHGERTVWGMGDGSDLKVYNSGFGSLSGLICYENHMTPVKSLLAVMGEEIHAAIWPGYWVAERTTAVKRRFDPGKDKVTSCDIDCAVREYAFETQTFVLSANMYLPSDALPEGSFDIAAGGSAVVNPSGLYLVEPVLNEERVILAELDFEERMATKAYFDCLGHYARWDVVRLIFRGERTVPVELVEKVSEETLSMKKLEEKLKELDLKLKKVEEVAEKLLDYLRESYGLR